MSPVDIVHAFVEVCKSFIIFNYDVKKISFFVLQDDTNLSQVVHLNGAYAVNRNKSQGQTFEKVGLYLRKDVFNHGQLYVACSRVRSWDSLEI